MLPKGQHIAHYRLLQRLKAGGMGQIYLAEDERLDRKVAIKVIEIDDAQLADIEQAKEATRLFLREARAIARFNNDHILQVYNIGEAAIDDIYVMYMVMPFCPEGSLADWLHNHDIPRPLRSQDVGNIVMQAAKALQLAHDHGIIHQDVKPENILVQQRAEYPGQLKLQLADFGIARLQKTSEESLSVRGTPFYMAPEQWDGQAVLETDQYSLAVMAYELLTGQRPFDGKNAQQLWLQHARNRPRPPSYFNPLVPPALDSVILRALAKNPLERYRSIIVFARAFQRACRSSGNIIPLDEQGEDIALDALPALPPTLHVPSQKAAAPSQPRVRGFDGKAIFLMVLAAILVIGSIGAFFYLQAPGQQASAIHIAGKQQATSNLTTLAQHRTSTAQAQQTGTAQAISVNATATARANQTAATNATVAAVHATATAIVEANATATVSAYEIALGGIGRPLLNDSLQNNSGGHQWYTINTQSGSCGFQQGSYVVTASANTSAPCFAQATSFSKMAYQITQVISKGDQGGITFCGDTQAGNYYAFMISASGNYSLVIYQNYQAVHTLAQNTSTAIHTGTGQSNLLAVRVANGTITLFINEQPLLSVNDTTYSQGAIGVIAVSGSDATLVEFNYAEVWKLS